MNNIDRRLLDPATDSSALKEILEKYKQYLILQKNPIYSIPDSITHADWIYQQFNTQNIKYFKIAGKFVGNTLTQIIVGYRIEISWGRPFINTLPFWNMGLLYFDDRCWRFPAEEFKQLNNYINRSFEDEDCNTFYVVQKLSPTLLLTKKSDTFFTKDKYFKSLPYDRYQIVLEQIFMNQNELDIYKNKFQALSSILPKTISRPIMLISARLDYFNRV